MRTHSQKKNISSTKGGAGFSLIEMMIYMAVLIIVSGASVASMLSFSDVIAQQKVKGLITQTANGALERITREIRNADGVDLINSVLDSDSGILTLSNDVNDVQFSFNSGGIDLLVEGGSTVPLINTNVEVNSVVFYHYTTGNTELVRVILTVSATSSGFAATEVFYGGVVVRGSYD